ncbi:MAG TPA: Zn-ribbon domain-containing OB-fold protein [Nitrososphaerales archaeon]|nr:Zn-ribbon domain-containing OB-fold protein [Nitrososphaerales archaeon]
MDELPQLHSRRALNLRFDIPVSKTKEFWDSLKEGKLVSTKCSSCGNVSFPPQADCPKCMGCKFGWVDLGTDATLVTFTHVKVTPASFAGGAGYTIAIAELKGGLKALAWLEGARAEDTKAGMKLRIEARSSEEGNPYYVFVPV